MQRYAVIGSPVDHSLSPIMHQAGFDALHIDAVYEAIEASSVQPAFERLMNERYCGWNVTTPLKEQALSCVDRLSEEAASSSAVNVVRLDRDGRLVGGNTDGAGFLRAVRELWGWEPRGASVLILGSGPAARSIAHALTAARVGRLYCWSRNTQRARRIGPKPRADIDLIVSALPASAAIPEQIAQTSRKASMLFDLNYAVARSPVAHLQCRLRSNGLPLLLHQGILSFEWWTARAAPVEVMRAALARHVSARGIL